MRTRAVELAVPAFYIEVMVMQSSSLLRSWLSGLIRVVVILALGVFGVALAPQAASAQNVDRSLERSIVMVEMVWTGYIEYPSTEGGWVWSDKISVVNGCTGWFVSTEGHVVTAGHCVDQESGKRSIMQHFLGRNGVMHLYNDAMLNWRVVGTTTGGPVTRSMSVMQSSRVEDAPLTGKLSAQLVNFRAGSDGDLALLKVSGLNSETPPLGVASDNPEIGSSLTAMGFPSAVAAATGQGRSVPNVSYKTGTISSRQVDRFGVEFIEISAVIAGGMSGGPAIGESGAVVGVVSRSSTEASGSDNFGFITDTDDLRSFLLTNGITPVAPQGLSSSTELAGEAVSVPAAAESPASSGVPLVAVTIGGVALVGVVAVLGWMLWRSRRPVTSGGSDSSA